MFHILDDAELHLPFSRLVTFVDKESHERLQIDPKLVRDQYRRELAEFLTFVRRACNDSAIDYLLADTTTSYHQTLRGYLAGRRKVLR